MDVVSSIFHVAEQLLEVANEVHANKDECQGLCERVQIILPHLEEIQAADASTHDGTLVVLLGTVKGALDLCRKFTDKHWVKKVWKRGKYRGKFEQKQAELNQAIADLNLTSTLHSEQMLFQLASKQDQAAKRQEELFAEMKKLLKREQNAKDEQEQMRLAEAKQQLERDKRQLEAQQKQFEKERQHLEQQLEEEKQQRQMLCQLASKQDQAAKRQEGISAELAEIKSLLKREQNAKDTHEQKRLTEAKKRLEKKNRQLQDQEKQFAEQRKRIERQLEEEKQQLAKEKQQLQEERQKSSAGLPVKDKSWEVTFEEIEFVMEIVEDSDSDSDSDAPSPVPQKRVLGDGGFGVVFEGVYHTQKVAVKKLNIKKKDIRKMWRREVKAVFTYHHPNIVGIIVTFLAVQFAHASQAKILSQISQNNNYIMAR